MMLIKPKAICINTRELRNVKEVLRCFVIQKGLLVNSVGDPCVELKKKLFFVASHTVANLGSRDYAS